MRSFRKESLYRAPGALIGLILLVFALSGSAGCSGKGDQDRQPEKIAVAVTPWPASASIYVAKEKNYFKDEGLDATLHSYLSGHLGLAALFEGKADFATAGETPIARAAVEDKPLAIVATISEIDRAIRIIARKNTGITAPSDLRGRKIGVVAGTTADFFLHLCLTAAYIQPQEVRIVDIETDKLVDALLNGEVDAVSTWSPFTMVLREKLGEDAVFLEEPDIYTMTWNIVIPQKFARDRSETIRKFLAALIAANNFIKDHPAEARSIAAKYIGTDSPLYEREWQDYEFTAKLDQGLVLNLEDQGRWITKGESRSGQRLHVMKDFFYTDALEAVRPGAVTISDK